MRKKVLITGCSGRFGTAFTTLFRDKYDVIAVSRRVPVAPIYDYIKGDVSRRPEDIIRICQERYRELPILINNAVSYNFKNFVDGDYENSTLESEFATNIISYMSVSKLWFDAFCKNKSPKALREEGACILNMSSIAALNMYGNGEQATYAAAKAAINTFTQHLAWELDPLGVRVNSLCPNSFPTLIPVERIVAEADALISSQQTGQIVKVDVN